MKTDSKRNSRIHFHVLYYELDKMPYLDGRYSMGIHMYSKAPDGSEIHVTHLTWKSSKSAVHLCSAHLEALLLPVSFQMFGYIINIRKYSFAESANVSRGFGHPKINNMLIYLASDTSKCTMWWCHLNNMRFLTFLSALDFPDQESFSLVHSHLEVSWVQGDLYDCVLAASFRLNKLKKVQSTE